MAGRIDKPKDDYSPDVPPKDTMSYATMGLASNKWARTERSWINVLVVLFWLAFCLAANLLCAGWYYGWDYLFSMLGWKP